MEEEVVGEWELNLPTLYFALLMFIITIGSIWYKHNVTRFFPSSFPMFKAGSSFLEENACLTWGSVFIFSILQMLFSAIVLYLFQLT